MAQRIIELSSDPLSMEDLEAALSDPVKISISPDSLALADASAKTVAQLLETGEAVYGLNTGFGKLAKTRIEADDLALLQLNIVRSHAAGVGEPLSASVTRLILLLKLKSILNGHSGVTHATIQLLTDLITFDILPVIPSKGSVGASGDLAPLAHMALVLIGEGHALYQGKVMSGAEALEKCGLSPVSLKPKEGLALLNGTQVSTALALDGLISAKRLHRTALIAGALCVDAIKGSDAPFDARIHALRPHQGQIHVASELRQLLSGSQIRTSHLDCERVQDPYSFRCQPQVMGAVLDLLDQVTNTLLIEASAVTDNPLIFPDTNEALSGGNFHAEPVAFAADILAIAVSEIGALSERRIAALIDTSVSELPPFLTENSGLNSGYMLAHVTAAALTSENKQLSHPASVDSLPTSANQEDHVSMATHGARRVLTMVENSTNIIAIELLAASDAIEFHRPLKTSDKLERVHSTLRKVASKRDTDRVFSDDIAAVASLISDGTLLRLATSER